MAKVVLAGERTVLSVADLTWVGDVSTPGTYSDVSQRTTVNGPDLSVASVDTTTLDDEFMTARSSNLPDGGTIDCRIYYNPKNTSHAALLTAMTTPTEPGQVDAHAKSWKITWSDGSTYVINGFLTTFKISGAEVNSNIAADVSIKCSGLGVLTPAT